MVEDLVEWFGASTPNVAVKDGVNDALFVSQNVPATFAPGERRPVTVTMQNTGTTTWSAGNLYRLGAQSPQDNSTWGLARVLLPGAVAPGASATFTFNVTAPATVGSYNFQWRMVEDTVEWFGAYTASLAVSVQGPAAAQIYYIHPDHLGTPREITRATDNQIVWRWDNTEAFGNSQPNEDPSALGPFTYNLRFPGQYFDAETGTHYNYFRDYDPSIGRYVQSDPIGLRGGLNEYAYANNKPSSVIDPMGLEAGYLGFTGVAASRFGIAGGVGATVVACKDDCNKWHRYLYVKVCGGVGTPGGSLVGGSVVGMSGSSCRDPSRYAGYFLEGSVGGMGGRGAGVDIGLTDEHLIPNGLSRVGEVGVGASSPGASVLLCYYFLIGSF